MSTYFVLRLDAGTGPHGEAREAYVAGDAATGELFAATATPQALAARMGADVTMAEILTKATHRIRVAPSYRTHLLRTLAR